VRRGAPPQRGHRGERRQQPIARRPGLPGAPGRGADARSTHRPQSAAAALALPGACKSEYGLRAAPHTLHHIPYALGPGARRRAQVESVRLEEGGLSSVRSSRLNLVDLAGARRTEPAPP